ncbi:hypothetical protein HY988_01415 [Candidatus Micrarchaeota archaeon]|nr:hypothetical protein [Candidatus Micrarchaeota archaeon]
MFPSINYATRLFRTSEALTFLCKKLQDLPKEHIRVLQVGIGGDFAGETLDILAMLEDTRKKYQLVCMDASREIVLLHSTQDEFEVDSRAFMQFNLVQLRALVSLLPCIRNLREIPGTDSALSRKCAKFVFDIPKEVLHTLIYVIGNVARDRLPADLTGFDAVMCFHTLSYIKDDGELRSAIENLRSYLLPTGVLALNGLSSRVNNPRRGFLNGLTRIYGPEQDSAIITEPRVFELS